jgi:four helix bundle protein
LLEGLHQAVQQDPVKTPIAEADAILVVLVTGVHGVSSCVVRYLEHNAVSACAGMGTTRPPARSFRDLQVWQKAHELVLAVYRFTESFPEREKFGLSHQMRRAAVSVPANIAEGFGKRSKAEKARFLNIAEGSLEECRYYLILAQDLGYGQTEPMMVTLEEASRLLNAYARALLASGS